MLSDARYLRLSFDRISRQFLELVSFVEPCDDNCPTYSHAIYDLFLQSCTEIETLFKAIAVKQNIAEITSARRPNITDYRHTEKYLGLGQKVIGIHFWRQEPKYLCPFEDWMTDAPNKPVLPWYSDYNDVKHDREKNFNKANFGNLALAYSGLFAIVAQSNILPTSQEADHFVLPRDDGKYEAYFPKYELSLL